MLPWLPHPHISESVGSPSGTHALKELSLACSQTRKPLQAALHRHLFWMQCYVAVFISFLGYGTETTFIMLAAFTSLGGATNTLMGTIRIQNYLDKLQKRSAKYSTTFSHEKAQAQVQHGE